MVPMVVSQKIAQEKHSIYNGLIDIRDSAPGHPFRGNGPTRRPLPRVQMLPRDRKLRPC